MNYLAIDTEYTSFFSPIRSKSGELLQLSIVPVIDGIIQKDNVFNEYCRPLTNTWNTHAEKVHGISKTKAAKAQHPSELVAKLMVYLTQFDRLFTAIGHNPSGDKKYIERAVFDYDNKNEWHTTVRHEWKDTKKIASKMKSAVPVKNHQLETLCKFFGIEIEAHDALSDAMATAILYDKLNHINSAKSSSVVGLETLSESEKRKKYRGMKYLSLGKDGCVFITEFGTKDPEALRFILAEIWNTYGEV